MDIPPIVADVLSEKHFYRVRSLQEIAAFNVIGNVFVNNESATEQAIYTLLEQLNLPSPVYAEIRPMLFPLCKTVKDWYNFQFAKVRTKFSQPSVGEFVAKHGLHWMWCGVVDCDKMAELIVREKSFGVVERFAVACEYSLQTYIRSLWRHLSFHDRLNQDGENELVLYWKAVMRGDVDGLMYRSFLRTEAELGMKSSLAVGNLSSIKHFWNLLSYRNRNQGVFKFSRKAFNTSCSSGDERLCYFQPCVVPFFILQMSHERQTTLVDTNFFTFASLLECLLIWPWQDMLIPTIDGFFPNHGFQLGVLPHRETHLLSVAVHNLGKGDLINTQIESVIIVIWSRMLHSRMDFIDSPLCFHRFVGALFASESRRCIGVVFTGVKRKVLQKVAFSPACVKFVCENVGCGNWVVVELVVTYMLPKHLQTLKRFQQKISACLFQMNATGTFWPVLSSADIDASEIRLEGIIERHLEMNQSN